MQNVTALVRRYVDDGRFPGTVTAVAHRDEVLLFDVYGRRDVERELPMTADTIFRIYSMTKPIVSLGLMQLYEEGRFQLDDPVAKYLPELGRPKVYDDGALRESTREMSVRDLLMHTSGLAASNGNHPVSLLHQEAGLTGMDSDAPLSELPGRLAGLPLQADPGTRWIYGVSTDLVGLLCEVIGGQPLDAYLRTRIFEPLGMTDTGFSVPEASISRFAACYGYDDGGFQLTDDPRTSPYIGPRTFLSGVAGLVSTANDYLRFARMLAGGGSLDGTRIIGPRTLRFMTANHLPGGQDLAAFADFGGETKRAGQGFGLGFGVLLDPIVAQTIGTPGEYFWGGKASTAFFVSPADELVVVFLTQLVPSARYPIRRELRAAVYGALD
ncbi:CubicO group peptidase (beta-lactamase class C family) [Kribbella rubisoli]|uniref:CubicO group peptidase (Beta-lactamase class C family) n=1 Tax=Kribbella rubisoli TaxID=3075929 RepID=A0A4Q7X9D2_9ACTN|nr:serine hydrolase domain-containing protein [Kribbella rubisoli]RZU19711.1 CubicO group peptidase (beta-lactamase class C family) [Kribbella rubisoli]